MFGGSSITVLLMLSLIGLGAAMDPTNANGSDALRPDDRSTCMAELKITEGQFINKTFQTLLLDCIRRAKQAREQQEKVRTMESEVEKLHEEGLRRFQQRLKGQGSVSSKRAMRSLSKEARKKLQEYRKLSGKYRWYERRQIQERKTTGSGSSR
jgi:hypothetical protein